MNLYAQATVSTDAAPTIDMLENRIRQIETTNEIDEAGKDILFELYRKSLDLIRQQQNYEQIAENFFKARELAPRKSASLRQQLEQLESKSGQKPPDSLLRKALPRLEQQLLSEKADLTVLSTRLTELENSLEFQSQRTQLAREQLAGNTERQKTIADSLALSDSDTQTQKLSEARRWARVLEAASLNAANEMLNQELLSQPMRIELLSVQRDKATLEMNRQAQYVELLEALAVERRLSDAETAKQGAEETERQTFGKHSLVQEIAQQNTRLGEELNQLANTLEEITAEENLVTSRAKSIAENFRLARQKLEIAGLGQALGQVLLEQRNSLPDSSDFKAADERRQRLVIESSLRQIRNQQERNKLRDINEYVNDRLAPLTISWQSWLREEVLQLSEQRRELIDKAIAAEDTFLQALGEIDFANRQLSDSVRAYNEFLDERLLWVRTGDPPSWETIKSITQTIGIFVSLEHWLELLQALFLPDEFPWVLLSGLILFALLIRYTPILRASLERSGSKVGQMRHDRFVTSLRSLLLTLILALPWPVLFTALGLHFQFVQSIDTLDIETHIYQAADWTGQFVPAIGAAFYGIALYTFYFVAFRIFCEPNGLAVVHFYWNPVTSAQLRIETKRLLSVFLPAAFLLITSVTYDPAALAGGLSRLAFFIVLVALALFFGRILAPRHGVIRHYYAENPQNPLTWFRYLWIALGILLPVMLAVLAIVGYVYTAIQFGARLIDTIWLIVAIILIHQLVVRWLLLIERQLFFNDALDRHRALKAARETAEDQTAADNPASLLEEPEIDFVALGEDTKKLINTALTVLAGFGLWAIWSDVMPAFRILNDVSLWSYSATQNGTEQLVPVTLVDVILGFIIVIFGIIAARRLPALMEIALLTRLNITAGSRYAITTLTQYGIVTIGIVLVFDLLGGSWSEIQWLIAALGVGIGFGLQEIVANFICGLILLFERPIRIGDTVTVGDTSGVVTRIRIRSTTIRNWDEQELIVPNKEFITGRLLNWTLSDPITRIVIPVGIAYGSDVAVALELIQRIANENERVLEEPQPVVTLESFADNALQIMLRCYIDHMDHRLPTLSQLNQEINRKFAAAGIVIAFPQRDIHLDTTSPLDIRVHPMQPET
jgi:potassium efflux system protein